MTFSGRDGHLKRSVRRHLRGIRRHLHLRHCGVCLRRGRNRRRYCRAGLVHCNAGRCSVALMAHCSEVRTERHNGER